MPQEVYEKWGFGMADYRIDVLHLGHSENSRLAGGSGFEFSVPLCTLDASRSTGERLELPLP
jgi:hypothetical protein